MGATSRRNSPSSPRPRCPERWRVSCGSKSFDLTAVHGWVVFSVLCWLGPIYRGLFASPEAEVDLRWFLRVRRSGVTIPLSTTRPTRIASPRTAWPVENAHTMAAPTAVPTTAVTRSVVQTRRRAAGRSTRNLAADLCSSPDLKKRAQQTSAAGIISRMTRIHSNAAILPGYTPAVDVESLSVGVARQVRVVSQYACGP